ncbi:hypothetical protein BT96DRAFT_1010558 [Gymnopus androsaceus JB14]|uniref:Uncharacterized protein n=1 Tax=Gymnopus androsaceus JB14 TaxID=1447944 RepID=A0A6A4GAH6_9AGAR|nr:hypothetical protein BT96DRAFT_1010558 [Gymnopus androsaceus JB14]
MHLRELVGVYFNTAKEPVDPAGVETSYEKRSLAITSRIFTVFRSPRCLSSPCEAPFSSGAFHLPVPGLNNVFDDSSGRW